jgi:PAS domain S-box-containing protein
MCSYTRPYSHLHEYLDESAVSMPNEEEGLEERITDLVKEFGSKACQESLLNVLLKQIVQAVDQVQKTMEKQSIKEAMIDCTNDCVFAVDDMGLICMANRSALQTFGYETLEERLIGTQINQLLEDETWDEEFRTKKFGDGEVTARRKDKNEFPCLVEVKTMEHSSDQPLYCISIRDLTDEKEHWETTTAVLDAAFDFILAEDAAFDSILHANIHQEPGEVATSVTSAITTDERHEDHPIILVADIVGGSSSEVSPVQVASVFARFDGIVSKYGLNLVKSK